MCKDWICGHEYQSSVFASVDSSDCLFCCCKPQHCDILRDESQSVSSAASIYGFSVETEQEAQLQEFSKGHSTTEV